MSIDRLNRFTEIAQQTGKTVEEVLEVWNERASIREYVGGLLRPEAEARALEDTIDLLSIKNNR